MDTLREVFPGIWCFTIPLPKNPLKWLNCYVIKGEEGGRNLLIDTGFRHPDCTETLKKGMEALELDPEKTDVFLTHIHPDHTGNAAYLQDLGCRIMMSETDYALEVRRRTVPYNYRFRMDEGGIPADMGVKIRQNDRITALMPDPFTADFVYDGDRLSYGAFTLRCVAMPGHSPGHMCLYEEDKKIMFLGDHVLFDITPNITALPSAKDALGDYLESLEKLKGFEIELALPGHRNFDNVDLSERIDELISHHMARLDEVERIVANGDGLSAYDITGLMTWNIHVKNWSEFPSSQVVFAYSETLSHLDYLVKRKRISFRVEGSARLYYK